MKNSTHDVVISLLASFVGKKKIESTGTRGKARKKEEVIYHHDFC